MKKKILSIITIMAMIISLAVPMYAADGDNVGEDIFGMSVYIHANNAGSYTIGDDFKFSVKAYVGDKLWHKETVSRELSIVGPAAVSDFVFFDKTENKWLDIDKFNVTEIATNVAGRDIKVKFKKEGTYTINFVYKGQDGSVYGQADTVYLTLSDGKFTSTTKKPVDAPTDAPTIDKPTTQKPTTGSQEETTKVKVGKTKVKSATKKLAAKKVSIKLKKINGAKKYQVQISKSKKFTKKNILVKKTVKKIKVNITSKKIKNKKKLWVRARAIKVVNGKNYTGKWSKVKKVKVK